MLIQIFPFPFLKMKFPLLTLKLKPLIGDDNEQNEMTPMKYNSEISTQRVSTLIP